MYKEHSPSSHSPLDPLCTAHSEDTAIDFPCCCSTSSRTDHWLLHEGTTLHSLSWLLLINPKNSSLDSPWILSRLNVLGLNRNWCNKNSDSFPYIYWRLLCPHTSRTIVLDAGIRSDLGWPIQRNWIPRDLVEPDLGHDSSLQSIHWSKISSEPASNITLDWGMWGHHACGVNSQVDDPENHLNRNTSIIQSSIFIKLFLKYCRTLWLSHFPPFHITLLISFSLTHVLCVQLWPCSCCWWMWIQSWTPQAGLPR